MGSNPIVLDLSMSNNVMSTTNFEIAHPWWKIHRDEYFLSTLLGKPLRRKNPFHLVEFSPHPYLAGISRLWFTTGMVGWMHSIPFSGYSAIGGLCGICLIMYIWWSDITREATLQGNHTRRVTGSHRMGVLWFIVGEAFFFVAFFWAFFHSSLVPGVGVWMMFPPIGIETVDATGIPLANTLILLRSGVSVTWRHKRLIAGDRSGVSNGLMITLICSIIFTRIQRFEYVESTFTIADGIYGSTFYLRTGFHGFHVAVGTIRLLVSLLRHNRGHFTVRNHKGFEARAWYWHFVDVVWLFLFVSIYWWGGARLRRY